MWIIYLVLGILLFCADQWSKLWALQTLSDASTAAAIPDWNGTVLNGIPHVFEFTYKSNTAGAMGIDFPLARYILIFATLILMVVLLVYTYKLPKRNWVICCATTLLISGGIGNLVDRIFRGYVPDFIRFVYNDYFPFVFNVADVFVCVGAFLLALFLLIPTNKNQNERSDEADA